MKKLLGLFAVLLIAAILLEAGAVLGRARESVDFFLTVMLPSLLPFFICASIIIETGITQSVSGFFNPLMNRLFKINGNGSLALILGLISGFPTGAKVVADLYDKKALSKNEAERLLAFSNNASPIFIITAIGMAQFNSLKMGYILLLAQLLAAFSVGFALGAFAEPKRLAPKRPFKSFCCDSNKSVAEIFTGSISASVHSCFGILGFIMFFSIISYFIEKYFHITNPLIFGLLEVCQISKTQDPYIISLALGFSGICVMCQSMYQIAKTDLSIKFYFWGKILFAALAYFYTKILLNLIPVETLTATSGISQGESNILAVWLFSISISCVILSLFLELKRD